MEELIGFDLDGVLVPSRPPRNKPFFKQTGAERAAHDRVRRAHYRSARLLMAPWGRYVIISGRPVRYQPETDRWLSENGLHPEGVYLMDATVTRRAQIEHKAAVIRRLGVRTFYEDDPKIVRALRRDLGDVCDVVEVAVR